MIQRVSQRLAKGSALRLMSLIANVLVGLYMMPFLIHSLGDEHYGLWIVIGAILGFYGLLDLGIASTAQRYIVRSVYDEKSDSMNVAVSTAVVLFFGIGLLSLLITLVIVLISPFFIADNVNGTLFQYVVAILGLKIAFSFPLYVFHSLLTAKHRFDIASYIQIFILFLRTALIIYFLSNGYGLVVLAIIMALCELLTHIITIFFCKKLVPQLKVSLSLFQKKKLLEYYHYGKYVYISAIADRVRFSIDDLVVGAVIGIGAVAHYVIAASLIRYFTEVMSSVFGVISPVLDKYYKLGQWENLREVFLSVSELTTLTAVLIGGLFISLGRPFIELWIGEGYLDAYGVLVILSVSAIIMAAQRPSVAILYSIAKHKYYAKITSIEAFVNVTISVISAHYIGIYGVALGTMLPALVNKLYYQPRYTCKQLDIPLGTYFNPLIKLASVGVIVFSSMVVFNIYFLVDSYIKLILFAMLLSITYLFICLKFIISKNTKRYLKEIVPNKYNAIMNLIL